MWWFVKKTVDNSDKVIYSYGFETKEQSGTVEFDKKSEKISLTKLADSDNEKIASRFLFRQLYRIITEENCPNERQIAIG